MITENSTITLKSVKPAGVAECMASTAATECSVSLVAQTAGLVAMFRLDLGGILALIEHI